MNPQFINDATRTVKEVIARLDRCTVGISEDCLWQMTAPRLSRLPSAPVGTNGAWAARQTFNNIVRSKPFNRFVFGGSK